MISESYDVVIVGGGPAGSTAARVIAENGLSCLILDRRRKIGIPVQCGEFLPTPREMVSLFPNSPRAQRLVDIPKHLIRNKCDTLSLVSPREKEYAFSMEFNVISRDLFDFHLSNQATQKGATLLLEANVLGIHQKHFVVYRHHGETKKVKAKTIIGADGPNSVIAQCIGSRYRDPLRDMSYSLQYVMEGISCDSDRCTMFFGSNVAPGGYMWIIPQSDSRANVGFGIRRKYGTSLNLRGMLNRFLKSRANLRNGQIIQRVGALIPVGGPKRTVHGEHVILLGDAAGHVMSTNGGGIPTALIGGEIAGETVVADSKSGHSLKQYEQAWRSEIGSELYRSLAMLRVADIVMNSDALTEIGMHLAGSRYLEDVIRCRYPKPLEVPGRLLEYFLTRI